MSQFEILHKNFKSNTIKRSLFRLIRVIIIIYYIRCVRHFVPISFGTLCRSARYFVPILMGTLCRSDLPFRSELILHSKLLPNLGEVSSIHESVECFPDTSCGHIHLQGDLLDLALELLTMCAISLHEGVEYRLGWCEVHVGEACRIDMDVTGLHSDLYSLQDLGLSANCFFGESGVRPLRQMPMKNSWVSSRNELPSVSLWKFRQSEQ